MKHAANAVFGYC